MLFERFEVPGLSHYSYAVGCPGVGKVAIVDPQRDVDIYLDFARAQGVEIAYILETHIHADYASGARELAQYTGAELMVSGYDKGELFEVAFRHRDLFEGNTVELGAVRIEALHTPGHTPEHLSFLVYDGSRSREIPMLMLTGDFLFVGSLGRPDLLGEEAKRGLAHELYKSAREKIAGLPDGLEIHPAHGAGSMCGSGMSGRSYSTLGFERIANPYLAPLTEAAFVERILESVPPFPEYYKRMKLINSIGGLVFPQLPTPRGIDAETFRSLSEAGHIVLDVRDQHAYGTGHIGGSFAIGAGQDLSTWASWVVPYDVPLLLVGPDAAEVDAVVRSLVRVGLDDIRGYLQGGIAAWEKAGFDLTQTTTLAPEQVYELLAKDPSVQILDVRSEGEWDAGHLSEALHIMGGELTERLDELEGQEKAIACMCGTGYRSTVACSILERAGLTRLINIAGGMRAWEAAGLPLEQSRQGTAESALN